MTTPDAAAIAATSIPRPTKEVLETLNWCIGAAVHEYYTSADDRSDIDAAQKWLDEVEAVINPEKIDV